MTLTSPLGIGLMLCWAVICTYWLANARASKSVARTESRGLRIAAYWLPLASAGALLAPLPQLFDGSALRRRFVPDAEWIAWVGLAACIGGVALAIWARRLLGRNWSATVQLKRDQELIQAGPYRWVRHPIYSGFLLLFAGTALIYGQWRGLLAVAIVFASFWRKLRLEERWLGEHFGPAYAAYRKRSKALIPWLL